MLIQWYLESATPAMFSLTFWSTKTVITTSEAPDNLPSDAPVDPSLSPSALSLPDDPNSSAEDDCKAVSQRNGSIQPMKEASSTAAPSVSNPHRSTPTDPTKLTTLEVSEPRPRKISIRFGLSLPRPSANHHPGDPMLDTAHGQQKKHGIACNFKRVIRTRPASNSKQERRAKESAEVVRTLIIGPSSISPVSKKPRALSKAQLEKVKSDLAKPKSANKVIYQLRNLDPVTGASAPFPVTDALSQPTSKGLKQGPIHAVCLDMTDEDVEKHHFAQLKPGVSSDAVNFFAESIVSANVGSITSTLGNLHIVDLVGTDSGFGQPADSQGILAGAVPTAETVITGIRLVTPQIMSLGYITGQAIFPDHKGELFTHTRLALSALTLHRRIPSDRQNFGSYL